jgi:hypothetical protein
MDSMDPQSIVAEWKRRLVEMANDPPYAFRNTPQELIRDLDVHLSGAFTVHPDEAFELRQLLDLDVVDGASLVRRVRDVVMRVEMLAMRVTNAEEGLARSTRALSAAAPDQTGDRDVPQVPPSSKMVG